MKIGIIGGGISGCFLAIQIKELHPQYEVDIFDHNDKLNKKIYATGNGKCNFANSGSLLDKYKNEDFVLPIIKEFGCKEIIEYFEKIGIPSILDGELVYPASKSAQTVGILLEKRCKDLGVRIILSTQILDYSANENGASIKTDLYNFKYDKVVIACGGKSSPQLGSDGSIFNILSKHKYDILEMNPSLCPIKTKENTKILDGLRTSVNIKVFNGNKIIHEETGELHFKDKGISGIVVFNACHYINQTDKKDISIHVDFAPNFPKSIAKVAYFGYVHPKLAEYLERNNLDIHDAKFTFKDFYDYSTSQVTSGGISLKNVNENLMSKLENNIYFVGEILDVDAVCGGFNMMWCFASANKVAKEV